MSAPTDSSPAIELTFEGCVQDAPDYGSDAERMVSRVFFWIRRDGGSGDDFRSDLARVAGSHFGRATITQPDGYSGPVYYAEVRQRVGEDFEMGRTEVGPPVGYSGALDQAAFARQASDYFHAVMTGAGAMQRSDDGSPLVGGFRPTAHVRLRHNATLSRRIVRL